MIWQWNWGLECESDSEEEVEYEFNEDKVDIAKAYDMEFAQLLGS